MLERNLRLWESGHGGDELLRQILREAARYGKSIVAESRTLRKAVSSRFHDDPQTWFEPLRLYGSGARDPAVQGVLLQYLQDAPIKFARAEDPYVQIPVHDLFSHRKGFYSREGLRVIRPIEFELHWDPESILSAIQKPIEMLVDHFPTACSGTDLLLQAALCLYDAEEPLGRRKRLREAAKLAKKARGVVKSRTKRRNAAYCETGSADTVDPVNQRAAILYVMAFEFITEDLYAGLAPFFRSWGLALQYTGVFPETWKVTWGFLARLMGLDYDLALSGMQPDHFDT